MKTVEVGSHLSKLLWAMNDWKRPKYGNPENRPCWWPEKLMKWTEMRALGKKRTKSLSNVNYTNNLKKVLREGYKFFGFDAESLCYIDTEKD
jgi:hypothetical protein